MDQDTIAAISTPPGIGAVGIVRISGPKAKDVLGKVWESKHHPVDKFVTHQLYYGKLTTAMNRPVDNVLAVYMEAPHSYTGENVVEIHCHGGSIATKGVLKAVLNAGARAAEAGEFTKRAFLNKKMDLAQAESVADIINATSERAHRIAKEQLDGRLSSEINKHQQALKEIKAFVEASIDFPEEDVQFIENEGILKKIEPLLEKITKLSRTYDNGRLIHDGVRIVIVGKPNVGKSSLLNALSGRKRAIVHHMPGTTRDTVEEDIEINGINFHLTDTAGIREAGCEVEQMGIDIAKDKMSKADMIMVVLEAGADITAEDRHILEETSSRKRILVLNKKDLLEHKEEQTLDFDSETKKISVSATTMEGIEELANLIFDFSLEKNSLESDDIIITNLRHKKAIDDAISSLKDSMNAIIKRESAEFVAHHLQTAMTSLGKITGEVTTDDVLNEIFSKFCIGK